MIKYVLWYSFSHPAGGKDFATQEFEAADDAAAIEQVKGILKEWRQLRNDRKPWFLGREVLDHKKLQGLSKD